MNAASGALPWLARTQADFGRLLRERGDGERAEELLAAAHATYDALGIRQETAEPLRPEAQRRT
jgi:hypothetical protein